MNRESQYLQQVITYETWHINRQGNKPEDSLCSICYPIDTLQVPSEFFDLWKYWAQPRCSNSKFNRNTVRIFEQLQFCEDQQVLDLSLQLVETIRYPAVPNFLQLIESLKFYWEVTEQFNNWGAYCSDNSTDISIVTRDSLLSEEEMADQKDNSTASTLYLSSSK